MPREEVEKVRASLDGWSRGDADAWLAYADPEMEFRPSGVYPGIDEIYRGREEMYRFWREFREPWETMLIRVDEVREAGEVIVSLCTFEGHARDGMKVEREVAWIWHFADGRFVRVESFPGWAEALEAAEAAG